MKTTVNFRTSERNRLVLADIARRASHTREVTKTVTVTVSDVIRASIAVALEHSEELTAKIMELVEEEL